MGLLRRDDIDKMCHPKWLMDGIWPAEGVSMVYGRSGGYKSFWTLDMYACVSLGRSWHGHKVLRPGPIIYVAGEGASGYKARLRAWEKQHGVRADDFCLWDRPVRLWRNTDGVKNFVNDVKAANIVPVAVAFDTLATCLGGASENDNGQMRELLDTAEDIGREWGAGISFVHHVGKAENSRTARGAQALLDGCAMHAYLHGDGNGHAVLDCTKQKDAEPFEPIRRTLHKVTLAKGETSLAFADDFKTGPRDETKRRVPWSKIRNLLSGSPIPMTASLVATVLEMDRKSAWAALDRAEKQRGEVYQPEDNGAYILVPGYLAQGAKTANVDTL